MKYIKSFEKIDNKLIANLADKYQINENILQLIFSRGIDNEEKLIKYLNPTLKDLHSPFLFKNMEMIIEKINNHIRNNSKILIFGDYDVDGISATYMMIKLFENLGVEVSHFLPNRYDDGYGLTIETADKVINEFSPDFIITVDCGIRSVDEVEYLKSKNIDIIITDHHEIGEILPDCLILNTKCEPDYPFNFLCGAGVVLKLVQAFDQPLEEFICVCAIATISDIVDLTDENRAIVYLGLKNYKKLPIGLKKLFETCNINLNPKSSDIAFKIAPKINASGRMGSSETSLQLYIEKDEKKCSEIIDQINNFNLERQQKCKEIYDSIKESLTLKNMYNTKAIIASNENWNVGMLGIVAARLAEEFNRPAFLFQQVGDELVGSARSVNGVNIHEVLVSMPHILEKFGGHTMAAGLTLKVNNYDGFCQLTEKYISENFTLDKLIPTKTYDITINPEDVNFNLLKSIEKMEPCGICNQSPIFKFTVSNAIITSMPKHFEHIIIKYPNFSLLAFNSQDYFYVLSENTSSTILSELYMDYYKGKPKISGIVKSIDYSDVYRPNDEEILQANYLSQLRYFNEEKVEFSSYNRNDLIKIILELEHSVHGILFIANDYNSYINFKSIFDSKNIIQNRIFEVLDQSALNTILLSPINFNYFNTFKKIVFLDPLLTLGYLVELKKHTDAKIYLPHKNFNYFSIFKKINTDRVLFGQIYRLFEYASDANIKALNSYDMYKKLLNNRDICNIKHIGYLQFMSAIYVFEELKILTIIAEKSYSIMVNKDIKTNLNTSNIFNKLLNI